MRGFFLLQQLLLALASLSLSNAASYHSSTAAVGTVQRTAHLQPKRKTLSVHYALHIRGGGRGGGGGKTPPPPEIKTGDGTATITKLVFNLVKNIVGAGVLSLSSGVAAFGNAPSALLPATALIGIIGVMSAFGFATIGKVCAYTGATSYQEAWERTVGPETAWIPAGSAVFMTFSACLAYSMILADTFSALLRTDARNTVLLAVTTFILLPLCWMKSLSALAPFSLLGVIGMGYTAIAMLIRYLDGSYAPGGRLLADVADNLKPSFGNAGWSSVFQPSSLLLLCMLSTAYMVRSAFAVYDILFDQSIFSHTYFSSLKCHFNAPKFYLELKDNTLSRYNQMTSLSFGVAIALTAGVTAIGFLTFGKAANGLVLNNYSASDVLMRVSRIAVAVSLVFSYPLNFQGCRDGILDVLQIQNRSNVALNMATVGILALLTVLAATLTDVSFVLSFGGATLGNLLTYVYPCLMLVKMVRKLGIKGQAGPVHLSLISALLGVVMGSIGAKLAIDTL